MARVKSNTPPPVQKGGVQLPNGDQRYLYYTDLNYMPSSMKNELWMAQQILFAKRNAECLVSDKAKLQRYRDYDRLKIDEAQYKKLFDPVTPLGAGGEAKYVASDWKACPLYIHLSNIVKAGIEKIPLIPEVDVIDKVAMDQQQKENARILMQGQFRDLVNKYNVMLGLPPMLATQDPYRYVKMMQQASPDGQQGPMVDSVVSMLDLIRSQISDEQDLALFNEYIYKADIEIVFELGIKHYLMKQNKWDIVAEMLLEDLKNCNTFAYRFQTDRITGRPMVQYYDPSDIYTSQFSRKDGEDITFWFHEYDITFADFVRQLGGGMSMEDLMDVFEYNKTMGGAHSIEWNRATQKKRDSAKIRIGYISVLTQNYDVFSEANVRGNYQYKARAANWTPHNNTVKKYQAVKQEKHYNVWYSAYYLPPSLQAWSSADSAWQSRYIYGLERNVDQLRFGNDDRFAKSELVVYRDNNASFMDVIDSFMPKINHLWHRLQNDMVQAIPGGKIMAQEMLGLLTKAVDGSNKQAASDSSAAARDMWAMIRQTGWGWAKFTDGQGNAIDMSKISVDIKSDHLKSAVDSLNMLLGLYDLMTKSLAMNSVREGEAPKPRVSLGGIQMSMEASNNGTWFIEKPYIKACEMAAERCIQYINVIAKETKLYNYYDRYNELKRVVGIANGLSLEGIADVPLQNIGLSTSNNSALHSQRMEYVIGLVSEMAKSNQVDMDILGLVLQMDNYKYAVVLLVMNYKKKQRELAKQQAMQYQQSMSMKQMDLQIAQALQKQKSDGVVQNTEVEKQWDMKILQLESQLKTLSQSQIKDQLRNNRIEQDNNKARLEAENKHAEQLGL